MARKNDLYEFDLEKALGTYYHLSQRMVDHVCTGSKKSASIRGFNGLTIYILSFLNAVEYDVQHHEHGNEYIGIYEPKLIEILKKYDLSKNEIENAIYHLLRERFIIHNTDEEDGIYYRLNIEDEFLCYNGIYMFSYPHSSSKFKTFIQYCNIAPFCNHDCNRCSLSLILKKQYTSLFTNEYELKQKVEDSPFFTYIETITQHYQKDIENIESYKRIVENACKSANIHIDIHELNDVEVIHYGKKLKSKDDKKEIVNEMCFIVQRSNFGSSKEGEQHHNYTINYKRMAKHYDEVDVSSYDLLKKMWLSPIMTNLLQFNALAMKDSEERYQDLAFPGLSLYWIQLMSRQVWVSNETIYEHMYRLTRMRYVHKIRYKKGKKPTQTKGTYFFKVNKNRFPCYRGICSHYLDDPDLEHRIKSHVCEYQPFCKAIPSECKIVHVLREKFKIVLDDESFETCEFLKKLSHALEYWIEEEKKYAHYEDIVQKLVTKMKDKETYPYMKKKYVEILDGIETVDDIIGYLLPYEIQYFGQLLDSRKGFEDEYIIWDLIVNTIYTIEYKKRKRRRKKTKIDRNTREKNKEEILRQLLEDPLEKEITY